MSWVCWLKFWIKKFEICLTVKPKWVDSINFLGNFKFLELPVWTGCGVSYEDFENLHKCTNIIFLKLIWFQVLQTIGIGTLPWYTLGAGRGGQWQTSGLKKLFWKLGPTAPTKSPSAPQLVHTYMHCHISATLCYKMCSNISTYCFSSSSSSSSSIYFQHNQQTYNNTL
jgi:hypothetical protein